MIKGGILYQTILNKNPCSFKEELSNIVTKPHVGQEEITDDLFYQVSSFLRFFISSFFSIFISSFFREQEFVNDFDQFEVCESTNNDTEYDYSTDTYMDDYGKVRLVYI